MKIETPQTTEATTNADGGQEQQAAAPETGKAAEGQSAPQADEQQQAGSEPEASPSEGEQQQSEEKDTSRGAPEQYQFRDPDGLPNDTKLDQEVLSTFADVARELDLSQDAAQSVIDKVMPKLFERAQAEQAEVVKQWQRQVETDQEIGGEQIKASLAAAKTAIEKLGTPELRQLLDGPIGNHPELVRFMVKVGRQVSEDMSPGTTSERGIREVAQKGEIDPNDDAAIAEKLYGKKS